MFCHQCGNRLYENARFCSNCGTPVREIPGNDSQMIHSAADANASETQTANLSADTDIPDSPTTSSVDADTSGIQAPPADREGEAPQEISAAVTAADAEAPASLILKKGKVTFTGHELHLTQKHYTRKPGGKNFRKTKQTSVIPLDSILSAFTEHHHYGGRTFLSLLLLLCFTAGALFSVRCGYDTNNARHTPYRNKELTAQENIMAIIEGGGDAQLLQYQNDRNEKNSEAETLSTELAELKSQQMQERLDAVCTSDKFDLDAFFNRELFSQAYQDYLLDLLNAFKGDEALHSWLYSYYETTKAYGGNYFLDTDMWIYSGNGENMFSPDLDSAASLTDTQYDLDLYEHILYTGRIYITGADFMRVVLSLPRYTVDGAVFAKAYGGVPDASEMSVPGWSRSHYEEFWLYGVDYYNVDTPMWVDLGFQAENFSLDWNSLIDETAYYTAYRNFMDKIAPGLPLYEMAVYRAENMAYGGMGYHLKGREASFSDIIACYAENHPEFLDELMKDKTFSKTLTTSVDEEISGIEAELERLESELLDLREQEEELTQLLADADIYRNEHALLLADIEQHNRELFFFLLLFINVSLLCILNILICLYKFFDFLKRPRHLFVIRSQDMEYAFHTGHCSAEQIADLQNRLSSQDTGSQNAPQTPFPQSEQSIS